jgi:type I restriction enzyme, S subunit
MQELHKTRETLKLTHIDAPREWNISRLDEIAEIKGRVGWRGYTRADFVLESKGAISLGANNITKENSLDLQELTYVSWKKYEESPEIHVSKGDIITAQRGSIGKVAMIDRDIGKATINPNILLIKKIKIDNFYLYLLLQSDLIRKQMLSYTSSTTIELLTQQQVKSFLIPLPSIDEQHKIASILSKVDELIQKIDQVIEQTQRLKKGLMQRLLTKGIGHTEFKKTDLGEIPEDWNIVKLEEVSTKIIDMDHKMPKKYDHGIPFVSVGYLGKKLFAICIHLSRRLM